MEIHARVALSLPNQFYKVHLEYDTFEKATYDSYLIASLVANSKDETEALKYINEITGNGSLNPHFKKLYKEISQFSKEQIAGILTDSLYPIRCKNEKNHFKYYDLFKATRMNDQVYNGNLADDTELLEKLCMPNDPNAKFRSISLTDEPGTLKKDNYNAIFTEKEIKVDLDDGQYYPISKKDFLSIYEQEDLSSKVSSYKIGNEISDGNWNVLTSIVIDSFEKETFKFKDDSGNLTILLNDCIRSIEIISVFDMYFFKETRCGFSPKNEKLCQSAVNFLKETKNINNYKTKSLIGLMSAISDKEAQEIVQFVLSRKDSKEIAEFGLMLIKNGLEFGWDKTVLMHMKRYATSSMLTLLYRIDSKLGFTIEEIINIDDDVLVEADKRHKDEYFAKKDNLKNEIIIMIGTMTSSGVREKLKKLQKDSVVNSVKTFLNDIQGHNKGDLENMSIEQLEKEYKRIKAMYDGNFRKVSERIKKAEED